jgi:hypothetical protein
MTFASWEQGDDEFEAEGDVRCQRYEYGADADGRRGEMRWDAELQSVPTVWKNGEPIEGNGNEDIFKRAEEELVQSALEDATEGR